MGTLALQVPQVGITNATEDVKVASDFTAIQTWANGNVDASNISTTAGFVRSAFRYAATNTVAAHGDRIITTAAGVTVTLPAPVANGFVSVTASNITTGASPTTVAGTNIFGVGLSGVSSFPLGTPLASVVLQSDGTNWYVVAGQQDTGWIPLTLNGGLSTNASYATPAGRLIGNMVMLRGAAENTSGGTISSGFSLLAASSFPAQLAPPVFKVFGVATSNPAAMAMAQLNPSGVTSNITVFGSVLNLGVVSVDSVSYAIS